MTVCSGIFTVCQTINVWRRSPGYPKCTRATVSAGSIVMRLDRTTIKGNGLMSFGIFLLPDGNCGLLELRYITNLPMDN